MTVDWDPAREWALFSALRQNRRGSLATLGATSVLPVWHETLGEPYIGGFRVALAPNGEPEFSVDFPNSYFKKLADAASAQLVASGKLEAGESYLYCVLAYPRPRDEAAEGGPGSAVQEMPPELPIKTGDLADYLARSTTGGEQKDGDMPVFIPQRLLTEALALAGDAGPHETGGVLIGNLHRDEAEGTLFLVATAQIPAKHTQAESASLTFTADTWADAQAAIRLRGTDETMIGWFHSHPVKEWCKECDPEKAKNCTLFDSIFSATDEGLHRTMFSRGWNVALLISDMPARDPVVSLHGWRQGIIEPRGYHILDPEH
jgi:proteasome lid subunit RPN8/RPN11